MAVSIQEGEIKTRVVVSPGAFGAKPAAGKRLRRWSRAHLVTGLIAGAWLLVMAITGVMVNHGEYLGLDGVAVSNRLLPGHYTDDYHPETNSLAVVIGDIHSGRFFGENGRLLGDLIALMLVGSVITGAYAHWLRRRVRQEGCPPIANGSTDRVG